MSVLRVLLEILLVLGLPIVTLASIVIGTKWTYSRVRRKGYRPPIASLISVTWWIVGALGAVIWDLHRPSGEDFMKVYQLRFFVLAVPTNAILVSALPRTNTRTFGPRRVRFSGYKFTLRLGFACLLFPALAFVLWVVGRAESFWIWTSLMIAVPFGLAFFSLAPFFKRFEDRMENPEKIEKSLSEDPRPPVLYLRPFQLDLMVFADRRSFERYFYQSITELIGPLIALGNPQDYVPQYPAVRLYATDSDWLLRLEELVRRSSCIIVEMARSDNLRTEFEFLQQAGLQNKLFIFTGHPGPDYDLRFLDRLHFGAVYAKWSAFSRDLAGIGYDMPETDPGRGSIITFDERGRSIILTTEARNPKEFVEPIKAWLSSHEMIGRCVPTSCVACGRKYHVFPADFPKLRERWCTACSRAVYMNWFERQWLIIFVAVILSEVIISVGYASNEGWLNYVLRWMVLPLFLINWWIWAKVQKSNRRRIGRRIVSRYGTLAAAGDGVAMANLGILCKGRDEVAAAGWFRKAAEAGDMGGMVNLAQMYEEGRGGLKNDANQALTWYRSAANIGSPLAQRRVQCADVSDETCASPNSHPHKKTI